jgi:hypothetical protein
MTLFWDVAPCSLVGIDRCFRGAYCLHHQGTSEKSANFYRLHGSTSHKTVIVFKHKIEYSYWITAVSCWVTINVLNPGLFNRNVTQKIFSQHSSMNDLVFNEFFGFISPIQSSHTTDGRIILKFMLGKCVGVWTGFIWLRIGTVAGSCEHGNEPSVSIISGEYSD